MFHYRDPTLCFRTVVRALLVRTAAVGVASCAILSAQTLLNTRTLSGSANDTPSAIATDSQGNVYLAGATNSPDFPVTHALFSRLPEPALRVSTDGHSFAASTLPVQQVNNLATSSDGRLVLAATNTGLYSSPDGGVTWTASTTLTGQILALAVDPTNSGNAYAVGLSVAYSGSPVGAISNYTWTIYKSIDGGVTWQTSAAYTLNPLSTLASRVFINPLNPSIVYAFVNSSTLMRSVDAGTTWQTLNVPAAKANNGLTSPTGFAIAPSQPNIAYATTYYFPMMKSFDGGATWQPAASIGSAGEYAIAVDPQNASTLWLVDGVGIHRSTDGAATFQTVATMGDGSWQSIVVSSANSAQVFAADKHNVYATFDGGVTWTTVASGQINGVFATAGAIYVAASVSPTVFLTKLDPTLTQVVYSTFIGPGSVSRIAVDPAGNVYLTGTTQSHSFPATPGVVSVGFASTTAGFVTKVRADGAALLYSAVFDGLLPNAIAADSLGNAVITGSALGAVPVTKNALQPAMPGPCNQILIQDVSLEPGFVIKLNGDASTLVYATYLAGSCGGAGNDVAIDSTGAAWVGGFTNSHDFPTTANALAPAFPTTGYAGFISQMSADGSKLLYSSFVGSTYDASVSALALDSQGDVILAGSADSPSATPGAYQRPAGFCLPIFGFGGFGGDSETADGFVMKLSPGASAPQFVATIGGSCNDSISHVALDSTGDIWVTGGTVSSDFPTAAPLSNLGVPGLGTVGFLAALDPSGATLISSSISPNAGTVAAGPGGSVYFTEPLPVANKTGTAVLAARIDTSQRPAIALDAIHAFGGVQQLLDPFYSPFAIAPGQVVRLIGRGIGPATEADATSAPGHVLLSLAGVQVTFNGVAAELVSVQVNQIVCFAPFELAGASSAAVQVNYSGVLSNRYNIDVTPQNVDIVAVANADGSANSESNPAAINSVVAVYLTGVGQTNPPSVDGAVNTSPLVAPLKTPTITVNGLVEQPAFLGAAVGQVAGIVQVNLFVPDPGASANDAVYVNSTFVRIWAH